LTDNSVRNVAALTNEHVAEMGFLLCGIPADTIQRFLSDVYKSVEKYIFLVFSSIIISPTNLNKVFCYFLVKDTIMSFDCATFPVCFTKWVVCKIKKKNVWL
jgi:hypothetical protein